MKKPFEIGMTADQVVEIAKRQKIPHTAKNEIVALESDRYVVKWHFQPCSLLIKFDFSNPPYRVTEILDPLQTRKRLTQEQATPTPDEVKRTIKRLKQNA